jgi:hypothetical protein
MDGLVAYTRNYFVRVDLDVLLTVGNVLGVNKLMFYRPDVWVTFFGRMCRLHT